MVAQGLGFCSGYYGRESPSTCFTRSTVYTDTECLYFVHYTESNGDVQQYGALMIEKIYVFYGIFSTRSIY
jgi:hypothetical protein